MPNSTRSVRILLTAAEAFPALERAFLGAKSEIWASFVVFNLTTRLRSPEARAIGKTWFDLIVHTLNRGVAVHVMISDSDPITRAAQHRGATRQLRMFSAAAAAADPGVTLDVQRLRHPAESGALVRLLAWPRALRKVMSVSRWLNSLTADRRAVALRDMDDSLQLFKKRADGSAKARFLSLPRIFPVVHHQKLAVVDRQVLFLGGLDLDDGHHGTASDEPSGYPSWNDVQLMIEGPVVVEAQHHLETFENVVSGRLAPPTTRRLLRTLSRPRHGSFWHFSPEPLIQEIETAHIVLTRRSTRFIYIETPCFCDIGLARALAETARVAVGLQMILMLPAMPADIAPDARRDLDSRLGEARQARVLRVLRRAFGLRLFIGAPGGPRTVPAPGADGDHDDRRDRTYGAQPVYVPSTVSVFDDVSAIVSSAGLRKRSLHWDTEAGIYLVNVNDVIELRHRVLARWLPEGSPPDVFDPDTAVAGLTRIAWHNAAKPAFDRSGCLLPYDFATADARGWKLPPRPAEFA